MGGGCEQVLAGGEVAGGMEEATKEVMAFRYEILLPNMPMPCSFDRLGSVEGFQTELGSEPTKSNYLNYVWWPDSVTTSKTEPNQTRF